MVLFCVRVGFTLSSTQHQITFESMAVFKTFSDSENMKNSDINIVS